MTDDRMSYTGTELMYEVRVAGQLGPGWSEWFEGLGVAAAIDGDTLLVGPIVDQAALHAVLRKVRDLGLTLLWVKSLRHPPAAPLPAE